MRHILGKLETEEWYGRSDVAPEKLPFLAFPGVTEAADEGTTPWNHGMCYNKAHMAV